MERTIDCCSSCCDHVTQIEGNHNIINSANSDNVEDKQSLLELKIEKYLKVWSEIAQSIDTYDSNLPKESIKCLKFPKIELANRDNNQTDKLSQSLEIQTKESKLTGLCSSSQLSLNAPLSSNWIANNEIVELNNLDEIPVLDSINIIKNEQSQNDSDDPNSNLSQSIGKLENFNDYVLKIDNFSQVEMPGFGWVRQEQARLDQEFHQRTKECQTWDSAIMCEFCFETREMLQNPNVSNMLLVNSGGASCIKNEDLDDLNSDFRLLKDHILEREHDYENQADKKKIIVLTSENCNNRARIASLEKKFNLSAKFAYVLQKIIMKTPKENFLNLTSQEQKWIDRILTRNTEPDSKESKTEIC